jgi:putative endonuclease
MPGLVPGIHGRHSRRMRLFYVYIMTNRPNGTLYVGVTNNLGIRAWQHREGIIDGFTKRYGLKRLVWYEVHESIIAAIQREKNIKHWPRAWKVRLILAMNPNWDDLHEAL